MHNAIKLLLNVSVFMILLNSEMQNKWSTNKIQSRAKEPLLHCQYQIIRTNYLSWALECECSCRRGQLLLLTEIQSETKNRRVRHDRRRHRAHGLRRGEEPAPGLHEWENGLKAELRRARDEPTHHLSATPVEWRQGHAHHLQPELEGDIDERRYPESVLRHPVPKGVLGKLEEVWRAVNVTLWRFQNWSKL